VRWAHSRDTKGDIELFLLDDLRTLRDPRSLAYYPATLSTPGGSPDVIDEKRGFRGTLNGGVLQSVGAGWSARLDLNLVSDAAMVKDTTTDVAQQANQYLRTSAVVNRRTPDSLLTFEVTARQDLAWGGFSAFENDRWPDVAGAGGQPSAGHHARPAPGPGHQSSHPWPVAPRARHVAAAAHGALRPAQEAAR
jgi:hypothetical protein